MKKELEPLTLDKIRAHYKAARGSIRARLNEFQSVKKSNCDLRLWEELVFCIFTAGASARMGLRAVEAVRPYLLKGAHDELCNALLGVHRYPRARSGYIVTTREYLQQDCGMRLSEKLKSFSDPISRRDWLAKERGIKGLGYKEASHYLRNIGYKGYAILDKHILKSLFELNVIDSAVPPSNRTKYLQTEETLKRFAREIKIDPDELDLVLWSMKTGEILK
jgi:N-glycosylase/DNA lyase